MKNDIQIQIQSLIEKLTVDPDFKVNYSNDFAVEFNMDGEELYIYDEGDGWAFELRDKYGDTIDEAFEWDCPFEMLYEHLGIEC